MLTERKIYRSQPTFNFILSQFISASIFDSVTPALPETNHLSSLRSPIQSNDLHLVSNGHRCLLVTLCLHHFMDYQQAAASLITSYHNLSICHAAVGPGVSPWTGPLLTRRWRPFRPELGEMMACVGVYWYIFENATHKPNSTIREKKSCQQPRIKMWLENVFAHKNSMFLISQLDFFYI